MIERILILAVSNYVSIIVSFNCSTVLVAKPLTMVANVLLVLPLLSQPVGRGAAFWRPLLLSGLVECTKYCTVLATMEYTSSQMGFKVSTESYALYVFLLDL